MLQLEAKPELRSAASESKRLLLNVRTWLLMVPLLYFAADGHLLTRIRTMPGSSAAAEMLEEEQLGQD